ncbi:MAG: cellulase family glycosylhydrolase, partial [Halobacteria archaeon]|nr:cellulase family glycosylhydrolase [Halobacteria archaeon]
MITRRGLLKGGVSASIIGTMGFLSVNPVKSPVLSKFVRRDGANLVLDGEPFYFSGTNNFWLTEPTSSLDTVNTLVSNSSALGKNAVRTWAMCEGQEGRCFQPRPGEYDEDAFRRLDYVVYRARQNGIHVILPFTDNWSFYGGMAKYVEWSSSAEKHDDFYTDEQCREWYRDYIYYLLNRENVYTGVKYKDDPTILAWELVNEPHAESDPSGDTLQQWIEEMSRYVKMIDSNHLVSTGLEGFYNGKGLMKETGEDR